MNCMKQVFKTMFASALGVVIGMGILTVIGVFVIMGIVAGVASGSNEVYTPKDNTVFTLKLDGTISDQVVDNPFGQLLGEEAEGMALQDVIKAIRNAKKNDKIKGIYLDAGNLGGGFASFEAIRRELQDFKESGKFIVSYADAYTQGTYYLASVADSVFVNPEGSVALVGLSSQGIFFKNLAAKLGIEFYIFKVGTYKSAVEPYFMDKFSDANREQLTSFLGSIWGNIREEVCKSRGIDAQNFDRYVNEGMAMKATQLAVDYKLADAMAYRHEAEACVKRLAGQKVDDKMVSADVKKMVSMADEVKSRQDKIAVVFAEGEIQSKSGSSVDMGDAVITEDLAEDLRKQAKDKDVKAVVLRVNSPGGSAYVSEQIWKAVVELKAVKPVVVSMGNYAASGGYYISCAANKIVAEHSTLTGSIGVFGVVRNAAGTFKLLDVTTDVVKTGTYADMGDMSRPLREDEKALIQGGVERTYDLFLTRCADGRGLPKDSVDCIGQGRVWTGDQALKRGLVDRIGGMDTAVSEAAALAGVTDYSVVQGNEQKSFFEKYLGKMQGDVRMTLLRSVMGEESFQMYTTLQRMKSVSGIQTRMPYLIQGF